MNNEYIGLTIGPIVKTLSISRKPLQLWTASYLFSYLMRNLLSELVTKGFHTAGFIVPFVKESDLNSDHLDVGIFPDRLIYENVQEGDFEKLVNAIDSVVAKISEEMYPELKDEITSFLKQYFTIYAVQIKSDVSNAIKNLNDALDSLELSENSPCMEQKSPIQQLVTNRNNFLLNGAFGNNRQPYYLLSEYATAQLRQKDQNKYDEAYTEAVSEVNPDQDQAFMYNLQSEFGSEFKSVHKYFCIVHADGDNAGRIVSSLEIDKLKVFSQKMLDFGKDASKIIQKYQGLPIYAGGDDLLFIVPVVMCIDGQEKHIFDLVKELDELFDKTMDVQQYNEQGFSLSMSYGIAINQYKYPLFEALEESRNLMKDAKKISGKNAVACSLQKGAGRKFGFRYSKSDQELQKWFNQLIQVSTSDSLISTAVHKIKEHTELFKILIESADLKTRVGTIIDHFFDYEDKTGSQKKYADVLKGTMTYLLSEGKYNNEEDMFEKLYSLLRIAKFINGKEIVHE